LDTVRSVNYCRPRRVGISNQQIKSTISDVEVCSLYVHSPFVINYVNLCARVLHVYVYICKNMKAALALAARTVTMIYSDTNVN